MELAHSTIQKNYIKQTQSLAAAIDKATKGELDLDQLDHAQEKLDLLADKYQYNEQIGSAIYKLYELQAIIHYFEGNYAKGLDFIDQAIMARGSSYPTAEKLRLQLLKDDDLNANDSPQHPLPLELQALIKGVRTSAIVMAVIAVISVYFIPWVVFYIILATKLNPEQAPNRKLIKAAAIATLPLCFGLIPIIIDVEFWRMNKKLSAYEESGAKAFMPDKQWLENEPKRQRGRKIALIVLISILAIFAALILLAALSG